MSSTSTLSSLLDIFSSSNPFSSSGSAPTPSRHVPPPRRRIPTIRISASQASSVGLDEEAPLAEPIPDPEFKGDLEADAITPADRALLQRYKAELEKDDIAECATCKQKWFDVKLRNGVCTSCTSRNKTLRPGEPLFYSVANELDFGDIPAGLLELSEVEQQLIARVHVHVEVFLYRGQQYKYRGHVVNFLRDVSKVFDQLPRLPQELDIILLRPANFN